MEDQTIERVVAERSLHVVGEPARRVRALIGCPEPFEDDFRCPYQIVGMGDEVIRHATGVDGIQALELALTRALPAWLGALFRENPGLRWKDAPPGDFGFSVDPGPF